MLKFDCEICVICGGFGDCADGDCEDKERMEVRMNTEEIVTTDIGRFGARERRILVELLTAWNMCGLPSDFESDNVRPMFNTHSGYVFLGNEEYQTAVLEDGRLVSHYNLGYEGHEGTLSELEDEFKVSGDTWHREDVEALENIREYWEVNA